LIAGAPATASIEVSGRPGQAEGIEGSVTRHRITLLQIALDLDRILVVGAPESAERLLVLARVAVADDDQPAGTFSGSTLLRSTAAPGDRLEQGLNRFEP
jgi:hypothetical protein